MTEYSTPTNQFLKSIDLQPYDRYLPNSFNDSLTMLEKVNKVIYSLHETNQLSNEMVNKWNEFAESFNMDAINQNIEKKLSDFLNDDTLIQLIDSELMSEFKSEITQSNDIQLSEIPQETASTDLKALWYPPTQPASDTISNGQVMPNVIYGLYDNLMNKYPSYITKRILGKDSSNTYDVNAYIFSPPSFDKTVIIGSGIHGSEKMSINVVYRFFKHLSDDFKDHAQLVYLRNRVRFVVMPIQNPHAFRNHIRRNANDVDINRNFNYNWLGWKVEDGQPKGSAPLSEVETQYIDRILNEYSDAVSYLDIHNTEEGLVGFYCGAPRYLDTEKNVVYRLASALNPDMPVKFTQGIGPTSTSHATYHYGLNSVNCEWQPGSTGATPFGSEDMTEAMKFLGNLIIQYSILNKPKFEKVGEPKVIQISSTNLTTTTQTVATWEDITALTVTIRPEVDGIIDVIGNFTSQNTDATAITYFTTAIIQPGHELNGPSSITEQQTLNEVYADFSGKRMPSTVMNATRVYGVTENANNHYGDVQIKFYFKASVGTLSLRRNRIMIRFTPTDKGDRYSRYLERSDGTVYKNYPSNLS